MNKTVELENRQYFEKIFNKLFKDMQDEIKADYKYRKNKKDSQIKNQGDYAKLLNISESSIKKIMGVNVKNKSILNIIDLLTICDKLNVPIKFDYQIGLHTCSYENRGMDNIRRNVSTGKYTLDPKCFTSKKEMLKKYIDYGPTFADYMPMDIEGEVEGTEEHKKVIEKIKRMYEKVKDETDEF